MSCMGIATQPCLDTRTSLEAFPGGRAEYVRVPKGNVNLLSIPDAEVPDKKALYLSDVLCTAYHCVMDTGVNEGDVVGIWVSACSSVRS